MSAGTDIDIEAEKRAAFAQARAEAAGIDGTVPVTETVPVQSVEEKLSNEIAGLVTMLVRMASPVFPSLPGIYTEETTATAAHAVAAVCGKHGWMKGGVAGGYGEEVTAACVLLPLALATYMGVKRDLAVLPKPEIRTVTDTVPGGGSKSVIIGAPMVAANDSSYGGAENG